MSAGETALVCAVAAGTIGGIIFRPKQWPEAIWACAGAALLVAFQAVPVPAALQAVARGTDVYLFLTGMMLLAELARCEGVFDWLAAIAVRSAKGSSTRLFTLLYGVGILVTVFLSNDATAVVLTPAVYVAIRKARADPMSYLFICAFIANAASFVLPISNPANLVVYGNALPPLVVWLRTFLLPSLASIAATYLVLRWIVRKEISGRILTVDEVPVLSSEGRHAGWGILLTGGALMAASAFGIDLGLPTCAAAIATVAAATRLRAKAMREIVIGVSWTVLPLVAGLFVLVEGLNRTGALSGISHLFRITAAMPRPAGELAASFGIAALCNLMNNLPAGLLVRGALQSTHAVPAIRDAVLIGVDLGPNLSVTGSLATVLWLIALRREGIEISGRRFLRAGALVMPPALLLSTLALWLFSR